VADNSAEVGFWVPACAGTTDDESSSRYPSPVIPAVLSPSFPLSFPRHSRYPFPVIPAKAGIQRWPITAPRLAS